MVLLILAVFDFVALHHLFFRQTNTGSALIHFSTPDSISNIFVVIINIIGPCRPLAGFPSKGSSGSDQSGSCKKSHASLCAFGAQLRGEGTLDIQSLTNVRYFITCRHTLCQALDHYIDIVIFTRKSNEGHQWLFRGRSVPCSRSLLLRCTPICG